MQEKKFHNTYHFVPVEKPPKNEDGSEIREHWLNVNKDFDSRQLKHYSHAQYHPNTYNGRFICRLTTEKPMFVGAKREEPTNPSGAATATPFELENGQPALPASSLRGLLSSIAESATDSALRVLNDQVLSYRQAMTESLSALGMVLIKENEQGVKTYYLKPLSLPTLVKRGQEFTFNTTNEFDKKAYTQMFRGDARLKVYFNGYDRSDKAVGFLAGKNTFSYSQPEFFYAQLRDRQFQSLKLRGDNFLHVKRNYVIGQKLVNNSPIISHDEWQKLPSLDQKRYTRGILRVLGKTGRDLPRTKKHELFIPYPIDAEKKWQDFLILPEAIERFHQLADDRTNAGEKPPLPYQPLGRLRNENPNYLKNELSEKGLKNGEKALRLQHGDLVYFKPTMQKGEAVVAEIAFSSIWRGRVEVKVGESASVHRFFAAIDPELLPFSEKRNFISPAELLFGFVQTDDDKSKSTSDSGRALAGRVQVSFGQLASDLSNSNSNPYYQPVTLKILATPKLPCPPLYFRNRYNTSNAYIKKSDLKPEKHQPQGRKMYLHHGSRGSKQPWKSAVPREQAKQKAIITPVKKGTEFFFHVDFNNLSQWELGLLCYALRPSDKFRHKLGMGKSIGLGTVRIDPVGLFLIDRKKRYAEDSIFGEQRYHQAWVDDKVKKLPEWLYSPENQAKNLSAPDFSWQALRDLFVETMSTQVKKALDLLGDPSKVESFPVHTPLMDGQPAEKETFRWFVENDKKLRQRQAEFLMPLDEVDDEQLPTLPLWRETRR